jgi:NADH-quinone oxidoreductase subunit L
MATSVALIPLLPLAGFVILLLFGKRLGEPWAGWVATAMVAASFLVACGVFIGLQDKPEHTFSHTYFAWIPAGSFHVDVGALVDPMAISMVLFITGIGSLIHLYAIGYMHGDDKFPKFFLYLNLFVFSMLVLVLGNNLLLTFLGWEGVGTCSYFLISFWFDNPANASAGKKAFITNRVGDWGFMVAMFFAFFTFGTLNYEAILADPSGVPQTAVTVIVVMLFVGAVGKSAQIPLYIWLPDAMAGPTPVSALIHAATMVTAGVYLMCRINPLIGAADSWVPWLIAWVGVITALVAASIACAQMDIKKVLAFSTVSQLGYMFLAVGVGAYWVAIFHMVTHAFFKALLFLDSGSVIHGMHDEQDMRRMGALRKFMPITAVTMMVGWLAIAGIPPFSGFWSKDEILGRAWAAGGQGYALYAIGTVAALMTAYYMTRLIFRTFYGGENWRVAPVPHDDQTIAAALAAMEPEARQTALDAVPDLDLAFTPEPTHGHIDATYEPHESVWQMTVPLVVLAVLSIGGGFLSLPFGSLNFFERWLEPVFGGGEEAIVGVSVTQTVILLIVGALVAVLGLFLGYRVWGSKNASLQRTLQPAGAGNGWFYDIAVTRFMGGPGELFFNALAWFDRTVIDGAVNGIGAGLVVTSQVLRRGQTGYVRRYALGIGFGTLILLGFVVSKVLVG